MVNVKKYTDLVDGWMTWISYIYKRRNDDLEHFALYYMVFHQDEPEDEGENWVDLIEDMMFDDDIVEITEKAIDVLSKYYSENNRKLNEIKDNIDKMDSSLVKIHRCLNAVRSEYYQVYKKAKKIVTSKVQPPEEKHDVIKNGLAESFKDFLTRDFFLESRYSSEQFFDVSKPSNVFNMFKMSFDNVYNNLVDLVNDLVKNDDIELGEDWVVLSELLDFFSKYDKIMMLVYGILRFVYMYYVKEHKEIGLGESYGNKKQKRCKLSQMKESNTVSKFMKDTITMIDKVQEQSDSEIAKRWLSLSPNEKHEILKRLFEKQALSSSKYAIITTGEQNSDSIVISNYFNNVEIKPIPRPDKYVAKEII